MATNTPKRGRGRPPKEKQSIPKNATEIIRKPTRTDLPNAVEFPDGDNNKYTTFALAIMQLPKIDVRNPQQLQNRVIEYFQLCADHDMKPGVAAVGLAIGLDRRRMWEIRSGTKNVAIPQECKDIIIGVYDSLEVLWESYMTGGKINPVAGIFLGKNNFQYADKQEYVVTPNTIDHETPVEVIEAKYDELPED